MQVSVIITNIVDDESVRQAIRSVYGQKYPDTRLIVLNSSAAPKAWQAICDELEQTDNHYPTNTFCVESVSEIGCGAGKNHALQHAWEDSDVFVFIDGQTILSPDYTAHLLPLIASNPKHVGLVYCDEKSLYKEPFSLDRLASHNIVGSRFMVSRSALEKAGRFDESLSVADDYDLIWRVSEQFVIVHVASPLIHTLGTHVPPNAEYYNQLVKKKPEGRYAKTAT